MYNNYEANNDYYNYYESEWVEFNAPPDTQ